MDDYALDFSFPSLPASVHKVGNLVASGETDTDALTEVVRRDPSVTVNVLQRVNSAYYGIRRDVESIEQAVRLLGFVEVCAIALIEGMNAMGRDFTTQTPIFRRILQSSVFTGRFTENMAQEIDLPAEETRLSFSSGLIHGTGRLVLLHTAPKRYADLVAESGDPLPDVDGEQDAFGAHHWTLAREACEYWELSDRICSVLEAGEASEPDTASPEGLLGRVMQAGSSLAVQDLTDEPFELPSGLDGLGARATPDDADPRPLVEEAAEDASLYASGVGSL
jgi:HD-like signal output (HDOD) protein